MAAKKKSISHLVDEKGTSLLQEVLPDEWTLRQYTPDYGIDFNVELFADIKDGETSIETLGEHVFVQLKSKEAPDISKVPIYARKNVSLTRGEELDKDEVLATIDAYKIQLEMSELETVRKMGPGVPVLLIVADIKEHRCSFVCLNDYIDKILVPKHDDFTSRASRQIIVPACNDLSESRGVKAFKWYAKRTKLYSAFPVFHYQHHMLGTMKHYANFKYTAQTFLDRISHYDFWNENVGWDVLRYFRENFPNIENELDDLDCPEHFAFDMEYVRAETRIRNFWSLLDRLSLQYEEGCREWHLPTAYGVTSSGVI